MDKSDLPVAALENALKTVTPVQMYGTVCSVSGLRIACKGLHQTPIGARCQIVDMHDVAQMAEVVGADKDMIFLMPYGVLDGVAVGCRVYPMQSAPTVRLNHSIVGRVLDGLGRPVDGMGRFSDAGGREQPLKAAAPPAHARQPVGAKLDVGVRVMNTLLPLCQGQRLGVFAGSGVGKSVLMSMLARHSQAEINVIGLIGERGREVREFIDEQLGEQGMNRSVVVVATSDEPALMRRQAAYLTLAIAEYFRDCGLQVMLMMDSVTRFAMAQREIGLSLGEPPTTRGYTPSVFAELPRLLERAGPSTGKGSISGIFSVLVEGSDMDEPVADAVRGILDGHIVLSRKLAERNHFPAIDVLQSISRMVPKCLTDEENQLVQQARQYLGVYENMAELIRLGAYQSGSDPEVDKAIQYHEALAAFLCQQPEEKADMTTSFAQLKQVFAQG